MKGKKAREQGIKMNDLDTKHEEWTLPINRQGVNGKYPMTALSPDTIPTPRDQK